VCRYNGIRSLTYHTGIVVFIVALLFLPLISVMHLSCAFSLLMTFVQPSLLHLILSVTLLMCLCQLYMTTMRCMLRDRIIHFLKFKMCLCLKTQYYACQPISQQTASFTFNFVCIASMLAAFKVKLADVNHVANEDEIHTPYVKGKSVFHLHTSFFNFV